MSVDREFWRGKSVFLTGHTGFKGGWLATWLTDMGATVHGFALAPSTQPSYFALCGLDREVHSTIADVRDADALVAAMHAARPEIVFHLAAQSLVRVAYRGPAATFNTNVIGTVNLLQAVRETPSVKAVVVITSDKCYESVESTLGHRESDALGGHDPYSASKACAELVCSAYRRSFFEDGGPSLATARAGNVIGGGDWSEDRLVPDAIKAFSDNLSFAVRNPRSVRPWQHVVEPLAGYLMLAERLFTEGGNYNGAWNFGPRDERIVTVAELADAIVLRWGGNARWRTESAGPVFYESSHLRLDCSKARALLGWESRLQLDDAIEMTVRWYRQAIVKQNANMYEISREQICCYEQCMEGPAIEVLPA